MQDLFDQRLGKGLEFLGAGVAEIACVATGLRAGQFHSHLRQPGDYRHQVKRLIPLGKRRDKFLDDGLGFGDFAVASLTIGRDLPVQIIDVVEADAVDATNLGIDVPRYRDVDDDQRTLPAGQRPLDVSPRQNRLGRGGRTDHHVHVREAGDDLGEADSLSPRESPGHGPRLFDVAIGDDQAGYPRLGQVMGNEFGVLAGPDDHHAGWRQIDLFLRQFHRRQTDGDRTTVDLGPGPHRFAYAKGIVKKPMENQSAHPSFERLGVGGLDLGEDLILADHLRIKPGGHFEQVPDYIHPRQFPTVLLPSLRGVGPLGREQVAEKSTGIEILLHIEVELQPIAGLEDHRFADLISLVHLAQHRMPLLGGEGHFLPDRHRAIVIRQIVQNQLHVCVTSPMKDKCYSLFDAGANIKPRCRSDPRLLVITLANQ